MEDPIYETVPGYITVGGHIVQAVPSDVEEASLTGLLVSIPARNLPNLDMLEAGYDRVIVKTTGGVDAFMYVRPQDELENHSTFRYKDGRGTLYEQEYETEEEQEYPSHT